MFLDGILDAPWDFPWDLMGLLRQCLLSLKIKKWNFRVVNSLAWVTQKTVAKPEPEPGLLVPHPTLSPLHRTVFLEKVGADSVRTTAV